MIIKELDKVDNLIHNCYGDRKELFQMNLQPFVLCIIRCPCGGVVKDHFTILAITADGLFCFAGPCPRCGKVIGSSQPLTEMVETSKTIPGLMNILGAVNEATEASTDPEFSAFDLEMFRGMGKAFGDGAK